MKWYKRCVTKSTKYATVKTQMWLSDGDIMMTKFAAPDMSMGALSRADRSRDGRRAKQAKNNLFILNFIK